MKLISERLCIRTLSEEDVSQKYIDWLNDENINQFLETKFKKQDRQSCFDFVKYCNESKSEYLFGIFENLNPSNHIGNIKIGFINDAHKTAELSFFIGEQNLWGKGYASEAINEICKFAFGELSLYKITAGCYENNFGSLKVLIKNGFQVEGLLREQVSFKGKRENVFKLGRIK